MPTFNFADMVDATAFRRTNDGYLVAEARVARTGIQVYKASDIGMTDRAPDSTVNVYRPEDEVFRDESMHSYAHRPITFNHPPMMVDAKNWRKYSVGQTGDNVARDGDYIRVPLVLMDAATISAVESGVKELSMGYTCDITLQDGIAPDGTPYSAVQSNLRMNHLAVVANARGGSQLKIGDDVQETKPMADSITTQTVMVDGLQVETTPQGAQAINTLTDRMKAATTAHDVAIAAKDSTIAEKDRELAEKDSKIADLEKKVLSDEALDQKVAERADLIAKAKAFDKAIDVKGKSATDIKKAVLTKVRGANFVDGKSTEYVDAAFDMLQEPKDSVAAHVASGTSIQSAGYTADTDDDPAAAAYGTMLGDLNTAWMGDADKTKGAN